MASVFLSKEPCFECKTTERTVRMKEGENNVVLCLEHLYPRLAEKPKKEKAPSKPKAEKQ